MALNDIFSLSHTLAHHREDPLGSFQDGFQEWLCAKGYSLSTMRHHVTYVTRLSHYLAEHCVTYQTLRRQHINDFLEDSKSYLNVPQRGCHHAINRFLAYLNTLGIAIDRPQEPSLNAALMHDYRDWLTVYGGCAAATIELRCGYLSRFFDSNRPLAKELATLTPHDIQQRFLDYANTQGLSGRRSMQATLRTFLRFCFFKQITPRDLSMAVPPLRTYKLSVLPRGLSAQDAERVFTCIDRDTKVGKRDYAIIRLLYHYGVRGYQIRTLHFCHIDWHQETLHFPPCKQGKAVVVPFVSDVGDALLEYVQCARPQSDADEVFLTCRAPFHPLLYSSTLSEIMSRYLRRTSPELPSFGAHAYRHAFATRLLQQGNSLKTIADLLGHRCLQTTTVYTKVDPCALQTVALELPGEITS